MPFDLTFRIHDASHETSCDSSRIDRREKQ